MPARKPVNPKASAPSVAQAKPGRPAFEPTPVQRETVKVMVAGGIQQQAIAGVLGISEPTLRRNFRQEIAHGAAEVNLMVIAAHLKRIRAGDTRAIEWWEKARMGWTEKVILDDTLANTPVRVVIELVGDASPAQDEPHRATARSDFDTSKFVQLVG